MAARQGSWYYLDPESGRMRTGWLQQGGNWYYLNGSGAMATGWVKVGGKDYYLRPSSGIMVTGKQTIGGKVYTFDARAHGGEHHPRWVKSGGAWYLRSLKVRILLVGKKFPAPGITLTDPASCRPAGSS